MSVAAEHSPRLGGAACALYGNAGICPRRDGPIATGFNVSQHVVAWIQATSHRGKRKRPEACGSFRPCMWSSTGIEKCLENLMSIVFSRYGLKKYRQKYRHFSKCPRSAPRYVVGPEFSCAEPPKAEPYASKLRATIDAKKQAANVVQADNDQWLLAPKAEPYTAQEASDAQQRIDKLNRALGKYNNVAPAAVLSDAPTATMAWGRSVARTLGYNVTFIRPNPDFHGVAVGGEAFVSASAEHPEIGLTSEAS